MLQAREPVLDERDAERDRGVRQRVRGDRGDELVEDVEPLAMEQVGAALLAEADRDHLRETALDRAVEVRVHLHAVDRDDRVRAIERRPVEEDRHARPHLAEIDGVHARADLAAHRLGRDPVAGEDGELALGGRSAVAAHGRDDEHRRAGLREPRHERADDLVDPVDPAAADGERHAGPGPDPPEHWLERRANSGPDVGDLGRVEPLAQERPPRERPGQRGGHGRDAIRARHRGPSRR